MILVAGIAPQLRSEQSLGDKIKNIFEPTPPPKKKKKSSSSKATPSPSPSPKKKESPSPSPSASPKKKASPSPSPKDEDEQEATPKPKRAPSPSPGSKKKKSSPSPTPSPEESPSPTEAPSPTPSPSASPNDKKKDRPAGVSISHNEISGFDEYPERVRKIIEGALDLASRNLSYKYGSADPANGGMDCSGFVYYLLRENGITDVPRDSSGQYVWVRKSGKFEAVVSKKDDTFELANLKPGDLLFWSGTYEIERDPPITHAMIYLGKEKLTGRRIMVGSSDGRTYHDQSRYGVSVFDFRVSRAGHAAENGRTPDFVGYGKIPGLGDG
ncbi:MAG: C40 family peptidase [Chthoniobacterales bacterium]